MLWKLRFEDSFQTLNVLAFCASFHARNHSRQSCLEFLVVETGHVEVCKPCYKPLNDVLKVVAFDILITELLKLRRVPLLLVLVEEANYNKLASMR